MAAFNFSIPSLPKETYVSLELMRKELGLTQRQAIILGIQLLELAKTNGPDTVKDLAKKIKEKYSA